MPMVDHDGPRDHAWLPTVGRAAMVARDGPGDCGYLQ